MKFSNFCIISHVFCRVSSCLGSLWFSLASPRMHFLWCSPQCVSAGDHVWSRGVKQRGQIIFHILHHHIPSKCPRCMAPRDRGYHGRLSPATPCVWIFDCMQLSFACPIHLGMQDGSSSCGPPAYFSFNFHLCYSKVFSETRKADSGGEFWSESLSQLLQL